MPLSGFSPTRERTEEETYQPLGITNARSLARHYAMSAEGGQLDRVRLLSPERIRAASELQTDAMDEIYHVTVRRGLGYRLGDDTGPGAAPSAAAAPTASTRCSGCSTRS